jgi:hypothetical protein
MKKLYMVFFIFLSCAFYAKAQYKIGIGGYYNTTSNNLSSYELSVKYLTDKYNCYDFIAGYGKEKKSLTIMKELHFPLFYPVDFYWGLGAHGGLWNDYHYTRLRQEITNDNFFWGFDGTVGLQLTVMPFAVSVGVRPVWDLLNGDNDIYWQRQIALRICF